MRARWSVVILGLTGPLVFVACGGGGTDSTSQKDSIPAACAEAPMRMQVELHSEASDAGGPNARITDALAQGTPILTGDAGANPKLSDITTTTRRSYRLYLADFGLSREIATSRSSMDVIWAENLLGVVNLEPDAERAIAAGDVLPMRNVGGESDKKGATAGFKVEYRDGDPSALGANAGRGEVEILYLDENTLCARIDMRATEDGRLVTAIKGTVRFPLVEDGRILTCARPEDNCEPQERPTS